jgi:predicted nucleotide-binding protein
MAKKRQQMRPGSPGYHVLFVDDDPFGTRRYVDALRDASFDVIAVTSVDQVFAEAEKGGYSAAIVDVMMPPGPALDPVETAGGFRTGIAVARRLRAIMNDVAILGISTMPDATSERWFQSQPRMAFASKPTLSPEALVQRVTELVGGSKRKVRAFIVHGRDRGAILELKDFLQNRMGLIEPIILDQQASGGRTLIEKFEFFAGQINVAFVLLTPDDVVQSSGSDSLQHRARQNVIFELGYFVARLGRLNGTVIVLVKGLVEIPSDIRGLVYIDITNGIESSGEQIRRELSNL